MNILPLILVLILVISSLTFKQIEMFKNRQVVNQGYLHFIEYQEGRDLSHHQRKLLEDKKAYHSMRKFNFRPFFDKQVRERVPEERFEQSKNVFKELVKILYGEAEFFKQMDKKRPQWVNEIIHQIIDKADEEGKVFKGRIENLAQMRFSDPELQTAFYHMLKGTIEAEEDVEDYWKISGRHRETSYKSLLEFLRDSAMPGSRNTPEKILVYSAPPELLLAIYGKQDIVDQIAEKKRELEELDDTLTSTQKSDEFRTFLENKPKNPGIQNDILDFKVP